MHEGNLANDRGHINAQAKVESIIRPRPLTRLPECKLVSKLLSAILSDPKQPLVFEKCV